MGSSKRVTVGYNYFGSFAQAIGVGPATRLTRITNGETEVWTGDLDQTSRDSDGKTTLTTTLGTLHFYWGRSDQNPDSFLEAAIIDFGSGPTTILIPAWRSVIYFVAEDIAFGSSPVPPSLNFEFERMSAALTLAAHHIERDALVPEVIYDLFTNALYGAGVATGSMDTTSFEDAADTIVAEGIGVSPFLDETNTLREFVGDLLKYIDGFLRYEAGQIKLGLIRKESTVGLPELDESVLTDEPRPVNGGWSDTWNYTRATFTDRDNQWEESAVEVWDDPANAAITGERIEEELRLPFVTRRAVAKILVKRKGIYGGIPAMQWELEVLPSLRGLQPGDRAFLSFDKLGLVSRLVRIMEVGRDASKNQTLKLLVEEERTRDESNDYVIPEDDFLGDPDMFDLVSTTPRLATLPQGILNELAGEFVALIQTDGFLLAAHRPTQLTTGFGVHFTWDPAQKAYALINTATAFPYFGTLNWWTPARQGASQIFRVTLQNAAEASEFVSRLQQSVEMFAVVVPRHWKSVNGSENEHQVKSTWLTIEPGGHVAAISATAVEFEAYGVAYDSDPLSLETFASAGVYPNSDIYIGRRVDFMVHLSLTLKFGRLESNQRAYWTKFGTNPGDTDLKRYLKATTFNAVGEQELADTTASVYDRNDTTMCPSGTFSVEWGDRAPTLAELYDLDGFVVVTSGAPDADIDSVDRILFGTAFAVVTDEDFLLTDGTNLLLGVMILTRQRWYNTQ